MMDHVSKSVLPCFAHFVEHLDVFLVHFYLVFVHTILCDVHISTLCYDSDKLYAMQATIPTIIYTTCNKCVEINVYKINMEGGRT